MNRLTSLIILLTVLSCTMPSDKGADYINGKQILVPDTKAKIEIIAPESVAVQEEFLAKIFIGKSDRNLIDAFVECDLIDKRLIDTTTLKVDGCQKPLYIKKDTIRIAFRPTKTGAHTFSDIIIITKDQEGIFRTLDYSFSYVVK